MSNFFILYFLLFYRTDLEGSSVKEYFRRFFDYKQMDFEAALDSMRMLLSKVVLQYYYM